MFLRVRRADLSWFSVDSGKPDSLRPVSMNVEAVVIPRIGAVNADHGRTSPVDARELLHYKEDESSVTGTLVG